MRQIKFYLVIISLFVSCSRVKETVSYKISKTLRNDSLLKGEENTDIGNERTYQKKVNLMFKDFEDFYSKFIKDSIYQLSHVKFPIEGQYQDYDSAEPWTKADWPMMKWDVRDSDTQEDSTALIQTPDKFFFGTYCLDCGFSFEMEFKKINQEWFLVYRQENNF